MRCIAEIADIGMTIDKKLRLTLNLQGASLVQLVQLQKDGHLDVILKSTPISAASMQMPTTGSCWESLRKPCRPAMKSYITSS